MITPAIQNTFRIDTICFLFLVSVCVWAIPAHASEDTLPLRAREAVTKGLAATEIQDYELAIKYFREAYDNGGKDSPNVWFYLALAYDKAGGRELPAIAWYRSFLGICPHDDKRCEPVRQRIIKLDIQAESAVRRLIKIAEENVLSFAEIDRDDYKVIAIAQAAIGDFDAASKSLQSAIQSYWNKANRVEMESKGKRGIPTNDYHRAVMMIALSQWKYGDSTGALKTIDWALTKKPYSSPYSDHWYPILYNTTNLKLLKLFIERNWKELEEESFGYISGLWFEPTVGIKRKLRDGTIESFLGIGDDGWYDLVRSSFFIEQNFICIIDKSCWQWDGVPENIWPRVATCERFQKFDQDWRVLAKKHRSDDSSITLGRTAGLAVDMAEALHFFRMLNKFHSNSYWGEAWR